MADRDTLIVELASGVAQLPRAEWDALAGGNPFVSHGFLSAMEDSGSVGRGTGWTAAPLVLRGDGGGLKAALPAYLKGHSQGEYVFDHSWADAWTRAGGAYYPKLLIAAPFSPVPGPRVLTRDPDLAVPMLRAAEAMVAQNGLSSAHATFIAPDQLGWFEAAGWLIRTDSQFHWTNRDYGSFDDFLADLSSRKRKAIRKEREQAQEAVDAIRCLRGAEIEAAHWDAFWIFYQDTGARKWGRPYLTRRAFALMAERMGDDLVLILAERDGRPIAGALNVVGRDTLYGRYWGAVADVPMLHFELCYYQAIDFAIRERLDRVEAGAQGGHKLARGYAPVPTLSAHYIADAGFRRAVADFLRQERAAVADEIEWLGARTPFRRDCAEE